jgi:hypothetical protein
VRGKVSELPQGRGLKILVAPRGATNTDALAFRATLGNTGTFDIGGLLPGAYTVQLVGRRSYALARQDVDIGSSDIDGLVLNLLPPLTLDGIVTVEGGITAALPRVQIFASHLEDHGGTSANVNPDGSFVMANLDPVPSVFRVVVSTQGYYVKSVALNQQDVKDRAVDLSQGGHEKLEILIRAGAGEIDGSVAEAAGQATAGVVAVPLQLAPDGSNIVEKSLRTDGTFVVPNLAPGQYRLFAVAIMRWGLWLTPEFLQAVQDFGVTIEVRENQRQQVQLKEVPQETIEQTAEQLGLTAE